MNKNAPIDQWVGRANHIVEDEQKGITDRIMDEDQEFPVEGECQINEDEKDVNDKGIKLLQVQTDAQAVIQSQQQQSQGPLVRWERFLPRQSLKVLLVENDDSTRHVVSALLRNCGYEVTAVANGLQAWKLLQDLTNHIYLVLTEVAMPCLSGIGLLSNIMSHKTCRNIPVIMMSSHDSMNVVFRCLSKGAVDFLVKPIRKNELKILWQHIWRRCHSASGSGSESAVWTQNSSKSKGADESDNDTDSQDDDDIGSIGLNARDGSDNGSGTQSSWTKRVIDVDSPKPLLPWDQLADPPDSKCTQVIQSRLEVSDNNWVPLATMKKCGKQADEFDNIAMGKDLKIGVPGIPNLQLNDSCEEVLTNIAGNNGERFREIKPEQDIGHLEKAQVEVNSEKHNTELRNQGNDIIIHITNPQIESEVLDIPHSCSSNNKNKVVYESKEMPSLEMSLKRLRGIGAAGASSHERNVLRHSAFSRYNSASTPDQAPTGNVGSFSLLDNCSEAAKTETMKNLQSNSNSTPRNPHPNGSSNNNIVGSKTNNAFTKPLVIRDKPTSKSTVKCLHPPAFQPVQNDHTPLPQPVIQAAASQCGSSNILSTPMEGNGGNYSLNGRRGSSVALNPKGTNLESNSGTAGKDETPETGDESGSRSRVGRVCFALREAAAVAALNKFRQKRKERCFEKKVQYQRRKKLAEQRSRVTSSI
ncbi:TWO-COMPONENT RESPONSE REGULATOR [Salix viminalis]|uniref:TWO-COMPONENT RESPONSE REGULATOR n=1 Tax=Salix viminalis TaxID=40686 RepID=A0A9Q0TYW1_SALVM|nr:TWO-COMPONENT RESPONSE REGULATOR [Salix viminalis]